MDYVAIISDLHGNIPALEATLQDIKRRGISRIFCLGDLVGKGPHSDKIVDMCQDVCEKVSKKPHAWQSVVPSGELWRCKSSTRCFA